MKNLSLSETNELANLHATCLFSRPKSFGARSYTIAKYTAELKESMKRQEAVGKMSEVPISIRSSHSFIQKEYETWTSILNQRLRKD